MCFNEADELAVSAIDGNDGPDDVSATFAYLIEDWLVCEMHEGKLHPYLDDTLNILHVLNWAQREIVANIAEDDPHLHDLNIVFDTADKLLQRIKSTLE